MSSLPPPSPSIQARLAMTRCLAFLMLFQLIVWTGVPLLAHLAPPLDAVEMHSWSLAPQWGYYKHPPFPAWIIAASEALFGKTMPALFIPAAISIALCYAAMGWLAMRLLPPRQAVVSVFLHATVVFCHLWSTDYNHNVAQMPLWAGTVAAYYAALSGGRARAWLLFGALLGASALAKYTAALLLPPAVAMLWLAPAWRRHATPLNVLLAIAACVAVFGAHGLWLLEHELAPLRYASERMAELGSTASWGERFGSFVGNVLVAHIVILLLAAWLRWRDRRDGKAGVPGIAVVADNRNERDTDNAGAPGHGDPRGNNAFLWVMGLGPLALALLVGLSGKALAPMWSMSMVPLAGIIGVRLAGPGAARLYGRRALVAWLALQLLLAAVYIFKDRLSPRSQRVIYPARELAAEVEQRWAQLTGNAPLAVVAGPIWEAGIVSFFGRATPQVLTDANPATAPWIATQTVRACGMPLLAPTPEALARWPGAQPQPPLQARNALRAVTVEWAILRPAGDCAPAGSAPDPAR